MSAVETPPEDEDERSMVSSTQIIENEAILTINTASLQSDTNLSSSIASHLSDSSITPLSSAGTLDNLSANGSIIITNDGIVWTTGGTLMLSRQEVENLQGSSNNITGDENLDNGSGNDTTEFDIKVDSTLPNTYKVENTVNETSDATGDTSFTINSHHHQGVLQQSPSDDSNELHQINFSNNENMTQFQVQLTMDDIHNLHKITNQNVLMSQAALPEDATPKHTFLAPLPPTLNDDTIEGGDSKDTSDEGDDEAKQFLASDAAFNAEEHGTLFIKNEVSAVGEAEARSPGTLVKSEITQQKQLLHKTTSSSNQDVTVSTGDAACIPSIVYVQVQSNGQSQIVALAPQSVQPVATAATTNIGQQQGDQGDSEEDKDGSESGDEGPSEKKRARRAIKNTTKLVAIASKEVECCNKVPGQRTLAPRLLSFPLYAGAQASLGMGKTLLKPYNYGASPPVPLLAETGQYFEVLGRCTMCFRFSRTTAYCRSEKNHRDPKSSVCVDCEATGLSTVVCRRKLNHTAPNAQPLNIVINTALQSLDHVKQLCVRNYLPACFAELHSIVVHHADITFVAQRPHKSEEDLEFDPLGQPIMNTCPLARKPTDYARGYLYPYVKEKWEQWLKKYCHQTGTNYRIRTGKRINKKTDHHGLANHNGKIVWYRTLETQLYNCALGGKPRKRKQKEGIRKRKERGSKLIGCSAVIHTRLIETKSGWKALEITVPKILAHLPFHDPRQSPDSETLADYNEVLLSQINPQLQQSGLCVQPPSDNFDFVSVVADSADMQHQQSKETSPAEIRKNTKHLLLTCASLVDTIESADAVAAVQVQTQELLNKLLQEATMHKATTSTCATNKRKRKKQLESNSLLDDDILEMDGTI